MMVVADHLADIHQQIIKAEIHYQRDPQSVRLLAVSKKQSIDKIQAAIDAGQTEFGENYVQEALRKMQHIQNHTITWHFIGPIQSNKTKDIASNFAWVHSVDRLKIAKRLSQQRSPALPPLYICLQVNIDNEPTKSGFSAEDVMTYAQEIATFPHIQLRGLMCIPKAHQDPTAQRQPFAKLRQLFDQLNKQGLALDTLSMGMSADLDTAIAEGSTMVRVGTGIFGART